MSRLNLDRDKIESCRLSAAKILNPMKELAERHSSVAIERASLHLLGIEEALLPKIIEEIPREKWALGALYWVARALVDSKDSSLSSVAQALADGQIRIENLPEPPRETLEAALAPHMQKGLGQLEAGRKKRSARNRQSLRDPIISDAERLSSLDPLDLPSLTLRGILGSADELISDPLHATLFAGINFKRSFLDQLFARELAAAGGLIVKNDCAKITDLSRSYPLFLSIQFINEQLNKSAGLPEAQIVMTEPFVLDPSREETLLHQIANGEMLAELFPRAAIQFILFPSETLDRATQGTLFKLFAHAAEQLGDDLYWNTNGRLIRRARSTLEETYILLKKMERLGMAASLETGLFANIKSLPEGGLGWDGVIRKDEHYFNPLRRLLEKGVSTPDIIESSEPVEESVSPPAEAKQEAAPPAQRPRHPRRRGGRSRRGRRRSVSQKKQAGGEGGLPSGGLPTK